MRSCPVPRALGLCCAVALAAPAWADHHETAGSPPEVAWEEVADVGEIEVVTRDEDGSERVTTIWLAVVDGQGYIRTGSTGWFANIERDPAVTLRIENRALPVRAELVPEDDPLWHRVQDAFAEKYGWSDTLVGLMPGVGTRILRVVPRQGS